ncbi:MAG: hypothetical protein ACXW5U_32050 [Thermoanaerobaculia bacterium]
MRIRSSFSRGFGGRTTNSAVQFATDLRSRLANRVQLSTDGFESYDLAIRGVFKDAIDYAQVVKTHSDPTKEERRRYSPSKLITLEIHKDDRRPGRRAHFNELRREE